MFHYSYSGSAFLAIIALLPTQSSSQCFDNSPVYKGFAFPSWNNDLDAGVGEYSTCTSNTDFYSQTFPRTFTLNNNTNASLTCEEALEKGDQISPAPPSDPTFCCDALYLSTSNMSSLVRPGLEVSFDIAAAYPGNETLFEQLCEELYACSNYQNVYSYVECEADGTEGCPAYNNNSLCFQEAYDPSNQTDAQQRFDFVVQNCYGAGDPNFNFSAPNPYSIGYLSGLVESSCTYAGNLSDRMLFVPSDGSACDEIVNCLVNQTNTANEASGAPNVTAQSFRKLLPDLCQGNATEVQNQAIKTCRGVANSGEGNFVAIQGDGGCRTDPTCPSHLEKYFQDFGPKYPSGTQYENSVASIRGNGIKNGLGNRTDLNFISMQSELFIMAEELTISFLPLLKGLPNTFAFSWRVAPWGAAAISKLSFASVLRQAWMQNGRVNSAEIHAYYENTRQMLDGSAAIYDEIVCRCAEEPRRGHGCDSIDNNCNQSVDECDEDVFAPDIDLATASTECSNHWYQSEHEAMTCLLEFVSAKDDCDADVTTPDITFSGTCKTAEFLLLAEDRCGNISPPKTMPVQVDTENPVTSCKLAGDVAALQWDSKGQGPFSDTGFTFSASDNCGGPLDVVVNVYSNEKLITYDSHPKQAILIETTNGDDEQVAGLSVRRTHCSGSISKNDKCIKDPEMTEGRLYTVEVLATDASGRVSDAAVCTIQVGSGSTAASTQRFLMTSFATTYSQ